MTKWKALKQIKKVASFYIEKQNTQETNNGL